MVIINQRSEGMAESTEEQRNEPVRYQDLKGMKVIDTDGIKFGTVQEIMIDPIDLTVTGIVVRRGFNKSVLIHKDYVERIGVNCVMLKIPPIIKSMEVIDINGEKVGKVKDVFRGPAGTIELIEVNTGLMSKSLKIPQQEIHGVGEKVILKHTKEDYAQGSILT